MALLALAACPASAQVIRPTNGPFGGIVTAIKEAPSEPSILYAGTRVGVYKSIDGDANWTTTVASTNLGLVNALAIDPRTAATVYAGTATGIFKTVDGGTSWFSIANSPFGGVEFGQGVLSLAIDSTDPAYVYAGTPKGVFYTFNGGAHWSGGGSQAAPALAMIPASFPTGLPTVFVASRDGVSGSTAEGLTDVTALTLDAAHATLYAGTRAGRVFKCTVDAFDWQEISLGVHGSVTAIATDLERIDWVYAATSEDGIWRTQNAGASWESIGASAGVSPHVFSLAIDVSGVLRAGTWNGIFTSPDRGETWDPANDGLTAAVVSTLAISGGIPPIIYAGSEYGGMFKTTDWGTTWKTIDTGLPGPSCYVQALVVDPVDPRVAYSACRGQGTVFKTTDAGTSWDLHEDGLAVSRVDALAIDPGNPARVYAGTNGGLFVSDTGGTRWSRSNPGLAHAVATLAVVPARPERLYAGTTLGNGVYVSLDRGQRWTAVWKGLGDIAFRGLTVDLLAAGGSAIAYSGSTALGGHLYTTVTGTSAGWTQIAPEWLVAATLALNPHNASDLYVGTTAGAIFTTKDSGRTAWEPVWQSWRPIRALAVDPADSHRILAASDVVTEIYQGVLPSPTPTPTPRPPTRTPTASPTMSTTPTATPTCTPSVTLTPAPTGSSTQTGPPTSTPSPLPTSTATQQPTKTTVATTTMTYTAPSTPTPTATITATASATTAPTERPTAIATRTTAPTATESATFIPTPSLTTTSTVTASGPATTPTAVQCPGDCDANQDVSVDELITGVRISLHMLGIERCRALDRSNDGEITIDELIGGVRAALRGCRASDR